MDPNDPNYRSGTLSRDKLVSKYNKCIQTRKSYLRKRWRRKLRRQQSSLLAVDKAAQTNDLEIFAASNESLSVGNGSKTNNVEDAPENVTWSKPFISKNWQLGYDAQNEDVPKETRHAVEPILQISLGYQRNAASGATSGDFGQSQEINSRKHLSTTDGEKRDCHQTWEASGGKNIDKFSCAWGGGAFSESSLNVANKFDRTRDVSDTATEAGKIRTHKGHSESKTCAGKEDGCSGSTIKEVVDKIRDDITDRTDDARVSKFLSREYDSTLSNESNVSMAEVEDVSKVDREIQTNLCFLGDGIVDFSSSKSGSKNGNRPEMKTSDDKVFVISRHTCTLQRSSIRLSCMSEDDGENVSKPESSSAEQPLVTQHMMNFHDANVQTDDALFDAESVCISECSSISDFTDIIQSSPVTSPQLWITPINEITNDRKELAGQQRTDQFPEREEPDLMNEKSIKGQRTMNKNLGRKKNDKNQRTITRNKESKKRRTSSLIAYTGSSKERKPQGNVPEDNRETEISNEREPALFEDQRGKDGPVIKAERLNRKEGDDNVMTKSTTNPKSNNGERKRQEKENKHGKVDRHLVMLVKIDKVDIKKKKSGKSITSVDHKRVEHFIEKGSPGKGSQCDRKREKTKKPGKNNLGNAREAPIQEKPNAPNNQDKTIHKTLTDEMLARASRDTQGNASCHINATIGFESMIPVERQEQPDAHYQLHPRRVPINPMSGRFQEPFRPGATRQHQVTNDIKGHKDIPPQTITDYARGWSCPASQNDPYNMPSDNKWTDQYRRIRPNVSQITHQQAAHSGIMYQTSNFGRPQQNNASVNQSREYDPFLLEGPQLQNSNIRRDQEIEDPWHGQASRYSQHGQSQLIPDNYTSNALRLPGIHEQWMSQESHPQERRYKVQAPPGHALPPDYRNISHYQSRIHDYGSTDTTSSQQLGISKISGQFPNVAFQSSNPQGQPRLITEGREGSYGNSDHMLSAPVQRGQYQPRPGHNMTIWPQAIGRTDESYDDGPLVNQAHRANPVMGQFSGEELPYQKLENKKVFRSRTKYYMPSNERLRLEGKHAASSYVPPESYFIRDPSGSEPLANDVFPCSAYNARSNAVSRGEGIPPTSRALNQYETKDNNIHTNMLIGNEQRQMHPVHRMARTGIEEPLGSHYEIFELGPNQQGIENTDASRYQSMEQHPLIYGHTTMRQHPASANAILTGDPRYACDIPPFREECSGNFQEYSYFGQPRDVQQQGTCGQLHTLQTPNMESTYNQDLTPNPNRENHSENSSEEVTDSITEGGSTESTDSIKNDNDENSWSESKSCNIAVSDTSHSSTSRHGFEDIQMIGRSMRGSSDSDHDASVALSEKDTANVRLGQDDWSQSPSFREITGDVHANIIRPGTILSQAEDHEVKPKYLHNEDQSKSIKLEHESNLDSKNIDAERNHNENDADVLTLLGKLDGMNVKEDIRGKVVMGQTIDERNEDLVMDRGSLHDKQLNIRDKTDCRNLSDSSVLYSQASCDELYDIEYKSTEGLSEQQLQVGLISKLKEGDREDKNDYVNSHEGNALRKKEGLEMDFDFSCVERSANDEINKGETLRQYQLDQFEDTGSNKSDVPRLNLDAGRHSSTSPIPAIVVSDEALGPENQFGYTSESYIHDNRFREDQRSQVVTGFMSEITKEDGYDIHHVKSEIHPEGKIHLLKAYLTNTYPDHKALLAMPGLTLPLPDDGHRSPGALSIVSVATVEEGTQTDCPLQVDTKGFETNDLHEKTDPSQLEHLQMERARVNEIVGREHNPYKASTEETEALLNYSMGETHALLEILDDPWYTDVMLPLFPGESKETDQKILQSTKEYVEECKKEILPVIAEYEERRLLAEEEKNRLIVEEDRRRAHHRYTNVASFLERHTDTNDAALVRSHLQSDSSTSTSCNPLSGSPGTLRRAMYSSSEIRRILASDRSASNPELYFQGNPSMMHQTPGWKNQLENEEQDSRSFKDSHIALNRSTSLDETDWEKASNKPYNSRQSSPGLASDIKTSSRYASTSLDVPLSPKSLHQPHFSTLVNRYSTPKHPNLSSHIGRPHSPLATADPKTVHPGSPTPGVDIPPLSPRSSRTRVSDQTFSPRSQPGSSQHKESLLSLRRELVNETIMSHSPPCSPRTK